MSEDSRKAFAQETVENRRQRPIDAVLQRHIAENLIRDEADWPSVALEFDNCSTFVFSGGVIQVEDHRQIADHLLGSVDMDDIAKAFFRSLAPMRADAFNARNQTLVDSASVRTHFKD